MTDDEKKPVDFPFDQVVIAEPGGKKNLSPVEFFALPLAVRIQYVIKQNAVFLADGKPVDSKEALGHIRKNRARLH